MKYPRFRVATCEGFPIPDGPVRRVSGRTLPGLSATVCDTLFGWRAVKTYRSEDRLPFSGSGARRGREDALAAAEDHAAYLNRWHRTTTHREDVRASRARERG